MRRRVDVWPSIADLFSALLLSSFGALMLTVQPPPPPKRPCLDLEAERIRDAIKNALAGPLHGRVRESADDVCIDVYLNFELDQDRIREDDRRKLGEACSALRKVLQSHPRWARYVEIWIEGHTDATQPRYAETPRDRYLYNWKLSSSRAASVLYEFTQCGVTPSTYRIRAIGYADTQPLPVCAGRTECFENRRTTFRIRPDKAEIARGENFRERTDCQPPR